MTTTPTPAERGLPETGSWIAADDVYRHARSIDVALNGEEGAASRPALCDVVAQIASLERQYGPLVRALSARPLPSDWVAPVVRNNDDGTLDEVVGVGQFHLEQMGATHWWMQLGPHMVNLTSKAKIKASFGENEAAPSAPAEGVLTDLLNLRGDETNQEVLTEFIRVCREVKPVGQWPGERVCRAIENLMNGPRDFISPNERSPLRFGVGRGNEGGRLGLMGRELAQSQHSVSGDGKCIWPDCGHDTNQVGYSPGCTGVYCPNKVDPPAKTAPEPLAQGDVVAYIESYEVGGVQRSGLVWADHPANTPGHTFKPLYASPQPAANPPQPSASVGATGEPVSEEWALRAMAKNYGDGPHRWDHLDRGVCERAADEIKALRDALTTAAAGGGEVGNG